MAVLQADSLGDLLKATLNQLGRAKFSDVASSLQKYVAARRLIRKKSIKFDSGKAIQFQAMITKSDAAAWTGMYGVDNPTQSDVLATGEIPWRHCKTSWTFEEREIDMNGSVSRILDLMKVRRYDAQLGYAELMESAFWGIPASSSDRLLPYGIKYWITHNATLGFNGGNPSGFSSVAGIDASTVSGWKNFSGRYTAITPDDLVTKMREAAVKTEFEPPMEYPSYKSSDERGYYTNYDVLKGLEDIAMAQNDNMGNDVAPKDGQVTFRRRAVEWVPQLDSDTNDPIYGIHWGWFRPVFLEGWMFRELGPQRHPGQHTTFVTYYDSTMNFECRNRREQWELSTAA